MTRDGPTHRLRYAQEVLTLPITGPGGYTVAMHAIGKTKKISLDESAVTIESKGGFMNSIVTGGAGSIRIPLSQIQNLEWGAATAMTNGYIRICTAGMVPLKGSLMSGVHVTTAAARDSNSILFSRKQAADFEAIRSAIETSI